MNKKILDVTVACTFCICLVVTAKIEERDNVQPVKKEFAVKQEKETVTAGVCSVLSGYSFTTESDEKTGITKHKVIVVAASPEGKSEKTVTENDKEDEKEVSEETEMTQEEQTKAPESPVYQNRWNISLTEDEIDLLARIVWLESRGESQQGQEAVVEVIFNRMASEKYPNTLYDVLSQKNPVQFCSWKNRDMAKPTEKEYQSIKQVLNGNTNILRNDTLYFSTEPLTSKLDVKIGGHSFCY